jgi:hypothetical protein
LTCGLKAESIATQAEDLVKYADMAIDDVITGACMPVIAGDGDFGLPQMI